MTPCSFQFRHGLRGFWLCALILLCVGCDSLKKIPFEHLALPKPDESYLEEDSYRTSFQDSRDPAAIRWLLSHRIENAMSLREVESAIGQEGRYEKNDRQLKTNSNAYRASDRAYAFGPDNQGNSYYLVFREKKLVGFDREQFRDDVLK